MSVDSHTAIPEDRSLELSAEDMTSLVEAAMARIVTHIESLPAQPAQNLAGAADLSRSLIEEVPEDGDGDLGAILDHLFEDVIPTSLTTPGPGFMAYVPGGGIFHAAVASLIANAVNRYVGAWAPAPGVARLEANVVSWLAGAVGYGDGSGGFLTTGGSLANFSATVAARHAILGEEIATGTVYTSDQVHHSVVKAARMAGFRTGNVRSIATGDDFRIKIDSLEESIEQDLADGLTPTMIVGSAGTTNTGAVDDLRGLREVADRHGIWFHVDGAYGGFFVLTARGKATLRGIETADSVTLDPHKGMFLPYGTGALVVRDVKTLRDAHSSPADYLPVLQEDPDLVDFCEISPELSRDFRGLRIWLPLKMHGLRVFRANLNEKLDLAAHCASFLAGVPGVEIVAPPQLSILAFRLLREGLGRDETNDLNRRFLDAINAPNRVYLTGTMLGGDFVVRICVLSFRTHRERVDQGLADIRDAAADLLSSVEP